MLDVNVLGVVYGIRAALPVMLEQGVGHIVSTASHAGPNGAPGIAPYVASKHAVVGLSESLFLELELLGSPVGASVPCLEFVKTDLMGKEPATLESPMAQLINLALAAGVDGGIPASDVGAAVVAAIKAGRFWILTHDSTREASVARVRRAADGVNPSIVLAGS